MEKEIRYERGQVFFLQEGHAYGAEMMSGRPVLILSEQGQIDALPTVVVACLSRTPRPWEQVVPVNTNRGKSNVVCHQLKTVDKGRLDKFMCKLTEEEMVRVDDALRFTLDLDVVTHVHNDIDDGDELPYFDMEDDLKMELAVYKRLYERALVEIVELRYERDSKKEKVVEVPRELAKPEEKEIIEKKRGRVKNPVPYTAKREEILEYANPSGVTNINVDPWYVIAATTGMNTQTAQNLVAYRNKNGKFKDARDLLKVSRFGASVLEKCRHKIEL